VPNTATPSPTHDRGMFHAFQSSRAPFSPVFGITENVKT
jgi:hypothetical protein